MRRANHYTPKILFFIGASLIVTNIFGLFTSLRNQEIFEETNTHSKQDITLTEDKIHDVINQNIVDKKIYFETLNKTINKGIAHYWENEGIDKYNLRIPFYENYFLYIASYIMPKSFKKYEFLDYRRAIERGVGLCSQQSIIVSEILNEKGIKSRILGLSGHTVATAQVDDKHNQWWILDPDYGVIIPHSIDEIEKKPEIIAPYYRKHGYTDDYIINGLIGGYKKEGNILIDGVMNYSFLRYWVEKITYVLIWIFPLFLMLPAFIYRYRK